ncbi:unnamed protein product [Lampetra fluviatilis]
MSLPGACVCLCALGALLVALGADEAQGGVTTFFPPPGSRDDGDTRQSQKKSIYYGGDIQSMEEPVFLLKKGAAVDRARASAGRREADFGEIAGGVAAHVQKRAREHQNEGVHREV